MPFSEITGRLLKQVSHFTCRHQLSCSTPLRFSPIRRNTLRNMTNPNLVHTNKQDTDISLAELNSLRLGFYRALGFLILELASLRIYTVSIQPLPPLSFWAIAEIAWAVWTVWTAAFQLSILVDEIIISVETALITGIVVFKIIHCPQPPSATP